jgi:hypothetical protein
MATYSFLDVSAAIVGPGGGFNLGSGAGVAEEGISVRMIEDKNTMQIGADGTGQHSLHAGKAAAVEVTVLKTSPVNAQLRIMYDLQTASSSLHGKNTITVVNSESGDVSTCTQCAFKKLPDLKYSKDAGTNVWAFDVVAVNGFMGIY